MVVIASSVVTWIGVQQLGYAEFAEIQRPFATADQRAPGGRQQRLPGLAGRAVFRGERFRRLWAILDRRRRASPIRSSGIALRGRCDAGARLPGVGGAAGRSFRDPAAVWTYPWSWRPRLRHGNPHAISAVPAYFDHGYLLKALTGVFAAALRATFPRMWRTWLPAGASTAPRHDPARRHVAIPTFRRESVLIDTVEALQASGAGRSSSWIRRRTRSPDETRLASWIRVGLFAGSGSRSLRFLAP